jgi:hypothetical protein
VIGLALIRGACVSYFYPISARRACARWAFLHQSPHSPPFGHFANCELPATSLVVLSSVARRFETNEEERVANFHVGDRILCPAIPIRCAVGGNWDVLVDLHYILPYLFAVSYVYRAMRRDAVDI